MTDQNAKALAAAREFQALWPGQTTCQRQGKRIAAEVIRLVGQLELAREALDEADCQCFDEYGNKLPTAPCKRCKALEALGK